MILSIFFVIGFAPMDLVVAHLMRASMRHRRLKDYNLDYNTYDGNRIPFQKLIRDLKSKFEKVNIVQWSKKIIFCIHMHIMAHHINMLSFSAIILQRDSKWITRKLDKNLAITLGGWLFFVQMWTVKKKTCITIVSLLLSFVFQIQCLT